MDQYADTTNLTRTHNDLLLTWKGTPLILEELRDRSFEMSEFMEVLETHIKMLEKHYRNQKHDLRARDLVDDILYDVLGVHFYEAVYGYINDKLGTTTEYTGKSTKIILPRTKIYYDTLKDTFRTSKKEPREMKARFVFMEIL